jgi:hypothetical protein
MRLVYQHTNTEVKVGDLCRLSDGEWVKVSSFAKPHKPESSGKVNVLHGAFDQERFVCDSELEDTYYVSIIGAEWVEREDQ